MQLPFFPHKKREAGFPTSPNLVDPQSGPRGLHARARTVSDFHAAVLQFAHTVGGVDALAGLSTSLSAINIVGGFLISKRMLDLFKRTSDLHVLEMKHGCHTV